MTARPDEAAVRRLFDHASSLESDVRAALLADVRKRDPALFDEVASLLRFHETDGVLDRPPMAPPLSSAPARLGAYRIIGELGRGGMGVVYEAQQQHPSRRVALKVLRPEIASEGAVRRFAREAEVLGVLHHPGIAQVFEAGEAKDDQGVLRTFIAMELVPGKPLTDFARREKLTVHERLKLIAHVADAIDHAHRRGVIHRDLKPGNILVEESTEAALEGRKDPVSAGSALSALHAFPKVLDFGIARLAETDAAITFQTHPGQVVGTLAYMSPEQAGGDPRRVDTRSDVYSLGAILYELLGGRPPIDLTGTSLTQAVTAIQQIEPELLGRINPDLRGDVEAIVAKSLEKDASRRYASAAEMAADIRRHLADEPVLAHAQTTWYQVRKFARRNRVLVGATTLIALALTGGVIGTSWQWWQAARERERATIQAERATETAAFLRKMLKSATPEGSAGRQLTVRELLDSAARDLTDQGASTNQLVAADTHLVLAEAYSALTEYVKSEDHARMSYEAAAGALGESSETALQAVAVRSLALANLERGGEGVVIAGPALELAQRQFGPDSPIAIELMHSLAGCSVRKAIPEPQKAEEWARQSVAAAQRHYGPDHDRTASAMQLLAYVLGYSGDKVKLREAIDVDKQVLAIRKERLGENHPRSILTSKDLSRLYFRAGDFAQAVAVAEPTLPLARRVMGPDHMVTISIESGLAEALEQVGRVPETLPLLDHVYQRLKATSGVHGLETMLARHQYVRMLLGVGKCDQAEALIDEQEAAKAVFGEGHLEPTLTFMRFGLAFCRHDLTSMEKLAERLRGTTYEEETHEAVEQERRKSRENAGRN